MKFINNAMSEVRMKYIYGIRLAGWILILSGTGTDTNP